MEDQTITIRRLGPEDARVLDRVAKGVFDLAVDPDHTAAFLASEAHEMVVALADGLVVGMASGVVYLHPDKPPQFWINEVGVGDDWLRRGIGTRLMTAILAVGHERGCGYAWLGTEAGNAAARGLYRKAQGRETEGLVIFEWGEDPETAHGA
ncbi:MAG: GNAT family N-acetyltransferase [Rhodobacter sp.]|nr:GNAT family N-acetyltransferase [Rhodobacter sp.]